MPVRLRAPSSCPWRVDEHKRIIELPRMGIHGLVTNDQHLFDESG